MRCWIVAVLATACGGRDPGPRASGSASGRVPEDASALPVPADAAVPVAVRIEAPPSGPIVRVAVTPGEDAALTLDEGGEARLWPALDGTRPPIAVELPPARAMAVQRAGADYVAVLGVVGGAWVVRLDAEGRRVRATELGEIDGVVTREGGFVTWRGTHVEWLDLDGRLVRASDTEPRPVAPASRVTAAGGDLVIAGPDGPRYLGYAFPATAAPRGRAPDHRIVGGPPNRFLVVDARLDAVRELRPWTPRGEVARGMLWLADRDWLVDVPSGLVVWTEGATTGTLALPKASMLDVEPESGLVLAVDESRPPRGGESPRWRLARYVPARHTLEPIAFAAGVANGVYLVPPSKTRGARVVTTGFERDATGGEHGRARWLHDLEQPERGVTMWEADGTWPARVTEAGALIVNHAGQHGSVVVDGELRIPELPLEAEPAPDLGRWLVPSASELELVERGGRIAWTLPLPMPVQGQVAWVGDAALELASMHGIASVAAATGTVRRVVPGWGFELARAPHPQLAYGRALAVALAAGPRDAPLALSADARFQDLARDVARRTSLNVTWWGPVRLDRAHRRVAFLQSTEQDGKPRLAYLVEVEPGAVVAIAAFMWGFPDDPMPVAGVEPAWGTIAYPDGSAARPTEDAALAFTSKWIHGSFETLVFTLERGAIVAVSDEWVERENTGSNVPGKRYATTSDFKRWPAGRRPKLATSHSRTARLAVSAPSQDPAALAAAILERMKD